MENNEITGFNIRVYAVCIENNKLLTLKEPFNGEIVTKLPGGGLEFGEGPVDCLKRELMEELNLEITDIKPFYIQENYIESFVKNKKQLVILYFQATIKDILQLKIQDLNIQSVNWVEINNNCPLTLPSDIQLFKYIYNTMLNK